MKGCIAIIIILLLLVIPSTSCSTISELTPKVLASVTQDTVEQVEADSNDVFSEIQKNIDMVTALKTTVQDARINGQPLSLDAVIKDLKEVTESYEKLSGQHDGIRQSLLKKIANIEDMQGIVDEEIVTLKQKRVDYTNQLQSVSDPNSDIVRTRKESLSQAIKFVDAQIILWAEFNAIEANIVAEMVNVQKTIGSFLSVIDSSAILFREGLNLLVLQRDINDALSLFTQDLPRMEQLTQDMEKSWANLGYLVETLTSVSTTGLMK